MPNAKPLPPRATDSISLPKRGLPARIALLTWASLFLLLASTAIIPSWRNKMVVKIWGYQQWDLGSPARGWLKDGGYAAVGALLPFLKPEGGRVRDLYMEMGGTALDRFWEEVGADQANREFFVGLLGENTSPELPASVISRLEDGNVSVRRAAIEIALQRLGKAERAWVTDSDLAVRKLALPYFLEASVLDIAIKAGDEMAAEALHLAVRYADMQEEKKIQLRRLELMPGANSEDPLWSQRHSEIQREVRVWGSKVATLDAAVESNLDLLMRLPNSAPPQLFTWLEFHGPRLECLDKVRDALDHRDPDIRRSAVMCLGAWKDAPSAERIWDMAREDSDDIVRLGAWEALKTMAPQVVLTDLRALLKELVAHPDLEILDGIELLGLVGNLDDIPFLQEIVHGYDHDASQAARTACVAITERMSSGR